MSEEKKEKKVKEVKKPMVKKANEELFRVGQEVEIVKEKFLVKEIKGIDVVLKRKDYK